MKTILLGNSFPLSLIRKPVKIVPKSLNDLKQKLLTHNVVSFWGHSNTINIANQLLNTDVTPKTNRPAIILNENNLPTFDGIQYTECWIISPDYMEGFRPNIGEEVNPDKIKNWQILLIVW